MKEMEWKECKLKCPMAQGCYGVIVSGKRDKDNYNVVYGLISFLFLIYLLRFLLSTSYY